VLHNGVPLHDVGGRPDAPNDWTAAVDQPIGSGVTRPGGDKLALVPR
jgi:hypothetical protein